MIPASSPEETQGSSYLGHEFNIISKNSFLTPPLPGYDASTYCFDKPWDGSLCVLWDGFMGTYSHTSNGLRCIIICTPLDVANGVLCCNTPSVQRVEGSTMQAGVNSDYGITTDSQIPNCLLHIITFCGDSNSIGACQSKQSKISTPVESFSLVPRVDDCPSHLPITHKQLTIHNRTLGRCQCYMIVARMHR